MKLKDIALSAAYVGQRVVKAICVGAQEVWSAVKYIVFKDKVVEQICVANFSSDGVGVLPEDAAKVTDIGTIFKGNTEITSFEELAEFENVKTLKESAFDGCSNLESIDLSNIEYLGKFAFRNSGLKVLDVPNLKEFQGSYDQGYGQFQGSALVEVRNLGQVECVNGSSKGGTFQGCVNLTKVVLPMSCKRIGPAGTYNTYAFASCSSLKEINLGHVEYIESNSFSGCTSLNIDLHNKYLTEAKGFNSSAIKSVVLRSAKKAFANFQYTPNLEYASLPNVESIDTQMFQKSSIKKVLNLGKITNLPSGNGYASFVINCSELIYVILPYTLQEIGPYSFGGNGKLRDLVFHSVIPPAMDANPFYYANPTNFYVPDESIEDYKTASNWTTRADKIKPISEFVTFQDVTSALENDVVYATDLAINAIFSDAQIIETGAKSMIYDVEGYDTLKVTGNGGTTSRLYCFIDKDNEVITTADESLSASPIYITIPTDAKKMVICCAASSTNVKVEIGKHVE